MADVQLTVSVGGREEVLDGERPFVLGRDRHADVHVDDARVAERHLLLAREGGRWVLTARPGAATFLGGRRVERVELSAPCVVRLADAEAGPEVGLDPAGRAPASAPPTAAVPVLGRLSGVHDAIAPAAASPTQRTGGVHRAPPPAVVRIGRGRSNDLVVDDLLASRRHAELRARPGGGYELVDLGSRNGTFVNGRRVTRAELRDRDVVAIGHHLFRLVGPALEEYVDTGEVGFRASGLTVRTGDGGVLLHDVGFALDERSFVAVVGPSGSGKSTLLNALTGFRPATEGRVLYGGRDLYAHYDELRARIGFVPQEDIVHASLSVRDALAYAAELRFPKDVSAAERDGRVAEVIGELGLDGRAGTPIERLSGGQRRRVSVGLELISRPSLLFLDEPTSGLDPGYERSLMELLARLAAGGRTVVVVTHSVESLRLCDRVLFLAPGGRMAYFGPAQLAPAYFGVADLQQVFQTLSAGGERDWSGELRAHPYHAQYVDPEPAGAADPPPERRRRPPRVPHPSDWLPQLSMLSRRYVRVIASDRRNLALLLLQPLLLGLLMLAALPAHQLEAPPSGELRVVSRAGLILLIVVLGMTWLGASNAIREIVKELPIVRRERAAGLSVTAYVASKTIVLGALTIVQAAILVPVALARQGAPRDGALSGLPLVELVAAGALAGLAAMTLALLISALTTSADRAMTVLPIVLILQMLLAMGGLFPDIVDKPVLKQAAYGASAQWAFSASAATVDLERLSTVDRLARDLPDVDLRDPTPVLAALAREPGETWRWRHEPESWLADAGVLLALAAAGAVGAAAALARRRPEA